MLMVYSHSCLSLWLPSVLAAGGTVGALTALRKAAYARLYLYPVTCAHVHHGKQDHQIVSAGKQHWFLIHQDLSCALHEVRRPYFPNSLGIRPFHSHACCTAVLSCTSTNTGFPPPRPQTQA
ncbi:hypothetical protein JB92DRAFT_3074589, partial [Gautieria morchelliformis]